MHNVGTLYDQLRSNLTEIELQIKHIKNDIARQYPEDQQPKINVWYWTYRPDGKPVLEDLLIAKANVVSAMANLKAADMNQKQPRR